MFCPISTKIWGGPGPPGPYPNYAPVRYWNKLKNQFGLTARLKCFNKFQVWPSCLQLFSNGLFIFGLSLFSSCLLIFKLSTYFQVVFIFKFSKYLLSSCLFFFKLFIFFEVVYLFSKCLFFFQNRLVHGPNARKITFFWPGPSKDVKPFWTKTTVLCNRL